MEEVLDLYKQPLDPSSPLICMDELMKQLVGDVRNPMPVKPGFPKRVDYEYERKGTANIFLFFNPMTGWRSVKVTERKTKIDFALAVREVADRELADVDTIKLISDNLNTHKSASFYEAFSPEEARRIASRVDFRHTPKHGSWLNMAEIELHVLTQQCLNRRFESIEMLDREVQAWVKERNAKRNTVDWRFTTADARIKLKSLYPSIGD